jgi:hypothetical protein
MRKSTVTLALLLAGCATIATVDMQKGWCSHAGVFGAVPADMRHYGWTYGTTVVQIHGNEPFAITYVNPEDDPSKGTTKASD